MAEFKERNLSTKELAELEERLQRENSANQRKIGPKAISGQADATATYGGGAATVNNPYTGGAEPGPLTGLQAPLLGSKEAENSQVVRLASSSGQPSLYPPGFANQVNAGDGNAESSAIAKQMLARGEFQGEAHKKRLEQIVETSGDTQFDRTRAAVAGNAAELKHQQALADTQWKALVAAGSDARNPMTVAEFDQAAAEFQRNNLARTMPNPTQVRKREDEKDNPSVQVTNIARSMMPSFPSLTEERLASMFAQPENGKNITQQQIDSVWKMARQATDQAPETGQVTATSKILDRVEEQIIKAKEESEFYDENGKQLLANKDNYFSDVAGLEAQKRFDADMKNLNTLRAKRDGLVKRLDKFSGSGVLTDSEDSVDLPKDQPAPAPLGDTAPAAPAPGSSYDLPVESTKDSFADDVAEAKRQSAASGTNKVVYVKSTNGSVYPITAK